MKTLVLANRKGGVGKSAITCQFAYYLSDILKLRVLVIDLDHQRNTTKSIQTSGLAEVSSVCGSQILTDSLSQINLADFALIPADDLLLKLEKQADKHNHFATNLQTFLHSVAKQFDVCIIDTNPNPDIRMMAALVVGGYVLSPIQLNQEAVDGIGALNNDIRKIQAAINQKLQFIGILPNLVENKPFQRANFAQLVKHFSKYLISLDGGRYAAIQNRTAVAEAQAMGKPVWKLGKTSANDAWREIKPAFIKITEIMGVA